MSKLNQKSDSPSPKRQSGGGGVARIPKSTWVGLMEIKQGFELARPHREHGRGTTIAAVQGLGLRFRV